MNGGVILLLGVSLLLLVLLLWRPRSENFGYSETQDFDEQGRREMCRIIVNDPDVSGSGINMVNCTEMPLTAFNEAMHSMWMCKKNKCGVVGVPNPESRECVRRCKQSSLLESVYNSSVFDRSS